MDLKKLVLLLTVASLLPGCSGGREEITKQEGFEKFSLVRPSDIEPMGWIRQFLEYQRDGLTGHIEAAGHPFNTGMWTGPIRLDAITEKEKENSLVRDGSQPDMEGGLFWWPYEQTGYYIDGAIKCGYLLGDSMLLNRARHQVEHLLQHPGHKGKLGPEKLIGRWFNWPYAGLFRSFITEYMETGDERIVEAMHRHYLTFRAADFKDELDVCNVEELCWLFNLTGDSTLLEMAEESYALFKSSPDYSDRSGWEMDFMSDRIPNYHGVVYFEIVKIPAMLYGVTGNEDYLKEALHGIEKMERHHMLVSGIPCTVENFRGISERAAHETCNVATLPYTYGTMLRMTGDAAWADKIERALFNGGLGAVTKDFTAHQYFSAPNQMIANTRSHHLGYYPSFMAFCPGHKVACCTGNVNRMMPYYAMQMWLKTPDNGIAAALFGPSEFVALAGPENRPVRITQTTRYPFDEKIEFTIETGKKASFAFLIRIPGWCKNPEIRVNGEKTGERPEPGSFYRLDRKFLDGDKVQLSIPMEISTVQWPDNGISFERGPVVYSFPVPESEQVAGDYVKATSEFPAYDLYPAGAWQYSPLTGNPDEIKTIINEEYEYPWDPGTPPVMLEFPARKVKNWELARVKDPGSGQLHRHIPEFPEEPLFSDSTETIRLIPYGSTRLRVTLFPQENQLKP